MIHYDLAVIGGGSGGFGAVLATARSGLRVALIEKADTLGGTSTFAGVNTWEPGIGGTGIPFDLYQRLRRVPRAVGIYSMGRHICWPDHGWYPGGESLIDPHRTYADTLLRHAEGSRAYTLENRDWMRTNLHGVTFEPSVMASVMEQMLRETGNVRIMTGAVIRADHDGERVTSIHTSTGETIHANMFIDSTGDGTLCTLCGCEMLTGCESRDQFDESAAPETATDEVNGVTLVFRVTRRGHAAVDPLPAGIPTKCWWRDQFPVASVTQYPNGDLNVNMLPTMDGREFTAMSLPEARHECWRRALTFWHWGQTAFAEWQSFTIHSFAPRIGIRESRRTACEYMLKQHDLEAGLAGQTHDDIIAIADHPMDTHGGDSRGCRGVESAYGVPYRSLIPRGFGNLLVVSRAAGFTSLAASSCRLSRTMMALGQAAGTAALLAKHDECDPATVDPEALRRSLLDQHVELDYPRTENLTRHLAREEES
jgi:hypothetical protein